MAGSLFARGAVLRQCYSEFLDPDSGQMDGDALQFALSAVLGRRATEFEREGVLLGQTAVSAEEFVERVRPLLQEDAWTEARQMFAAFDVHCRGYLTLEDVRDVFSAVAPEIPQHVVDGVFAEADDRGTGKLSLRQFLSMVEDEVTHR